MSIEQITAFINRLEKEAKALKTESIQQCWFMRGGLSYDDAMQLSMTEREIINKLISDNLEITKKTGMPFY